VTQSEEVALRKLEGAISKWREYVRNTANHLERDVIKAMDQLRAARSKSDPIGVRVPDGQVLYGVREVPEDGALCGNRDCIVPPAPQPDFAKRLRRVEQLIGIDDSVD
jgi:hypothetical protein